MKSENQIEAQLRRLVQIKETSDLQDREKLIIAAHISVLQWVLNSEGKAPAAYCQKMVQKMMEQQRINQSKEKAKFGRFFSTCKPTSRDFVLILDDD